MTERAGRSSADRQPGGDRTRLRRSRRDATAPFHAAALALSPEALLHGSREAGNGTAVDPLVARRLLELQTTHGNQHVQRLLTRGDGQRAAATRAPVSVEAPSSLAGTAAREQSPRGVEPPAAQLLRKGRALPKGRVSIGTQNNAFVMLVNQWQEAAISGVKSELLNLRLANLSKRLERLVARVNRVQIAAAQAQAAIDILLSFADDLAGVFGPIGKGVKKAIDVGVAIKKLIAVAGYKDGAIVDVKQFISNKGFVDVTSKVEKALSDWITGKSKTLRDAARKEITHQYRKNRKLRTDPEAFTNKVFQAIFPSWAGYGKTPADLPLTTRKIVKARLQKSLQSTKAAAGRAIRAQDRKSGVLGEMSDDKKRSPAEQKKLDAEIQKLMSNVLKAEAAAELIDLLKGKKESGGGAEAQVFIRLQHKLDPSKPEGEDYKNRLSTMLLMLTLVQQGRLKKSIVIPEVMLRLSDSEEVVQAVAAKVLAKMNAAVAIPAIIDAMRKCKSKGRRRPFQSALVSLGMKVRSYGLE